MLFYYISTLSYFAGFMRLNLMQIIKRIARKGETPSYSVLPDGVQGG